MREDLKAERAKVDEGLKNVNESADDSKRSHQNKNLR
jgi:hypothetical protein